MSSLPSFFIFPSIPIYLLMLPSPDLIRFAKESETLIDSGLATLGTNISTNSIATSNDFAFIFPKYLNIKRGAFLTSILGGWVTCPWQIQKSAQSLTTFLSGYVIVLAPLLAIMVCPPLPLCPRDIPRYHVVCRVVLIVDHRLLPRLLQRHEISQSRNPGGAFIAEWKLRQSRTGGRDGGG
ncbi:MAG: hypothetical protein EOO38_24245 [Cytophagaceae bacterium]|nr:MAG: hypothetical protein EOO38_24245 [Cytophagaceae bacterium]